MIFHDCHIVLKDYPLIQSGCFGGLVGLWSVDREGEMGGKTDKDVSF